MANKYHRPAGRSSYELEQYILSLEQRLDPSIRVEEIVRLSSTTASTDDLPEGSSNLYFTNERVDDRVDALITDGHGVDTTYDDTAGTLTVAVDESELDHSLLGSLNSTDYTHLTAANHTDLTDGNATTLHKHSHTNLDDIGTTTHANLDIHVGLTKLNAHGNAADAICSFDSGLDVGADSAKARFGTGDDMSISYDGTKGIIKVDEVAASDLQVECGTDKTVVLTEVVWDDMRVTPGSFDRPGISDPDIVAYDVNAGGISTYLWEFAKNDIASFTVQLPHSYKQGEDISVHIHWTPGARATRKTGLRWDGR